MVLQPQITPRRLSRFKQDAICGTVSVRHTSWYLPKYHGSAYLGMSAMYFGMYRKVCFRDIDTYCTYSYCTYASPVAWVPAATVRSPRLCCPHLRARWAVVIISWYRTYSCILAHYRLPVQPTNLSPEKRTFLPFSECNNIVTHPGTRVLPQLRGARQCHCLARKQI